jgi:membrane protease YdiL (CAAX protease family)
MEEMEQQPAEGNRIIDVPWTIADMALGAAIAIGVFVVVIVALAIVAIALLSPEIVSQIVGADYTELFALLDSEGVLNTYLVLSLVASIIGEAGMPFGAWLFGVRKYRCGWQSLGFRRFAVKKGLLLSAAVVGLGIAISILYQLLLGGAESQTSTEALTESGLGMVYLVILAVIVAPIAEETFFRGFLFPGISKRWGYSWGVVVSGALFALAHVVNVVFSPAAASALVPFFILGMLLAWLYRKTGSLWPCIITHFAYNSLALLFMVIY